MSERMIRVKDIELCTESFGNPAHPAVLLIMGATASMLWWEEDFCRLLAEKGFFVIRYDNRDTGRSASYEPGRPGYTFEDMADDAIAVLDAYGVKKAHFAGMSMGGMVVQIIALRHPDRVQSISLVSTMYFGPGWEELPQMEAKVEAFFNSMGEMDWSDPQTLLRNAVDKWRILAGSKHPLDEERVTALAERDIGRTLNYASSFNHSYVTGGEAYLGRYGEIQTPALVIHGTEDPIIPYVHGEALRDSIPGAELLTLEGIGHELPRAEWPAIIGGIAKYAAL
ncbi:acetyltransferase [Paenibacillus chitinolyticus]|uniref:alpha/beta fold hydrolase n=1 Tax=Paenibacillus chitinolyticus TaxID=79263 RepID=UPI0026E4D5FE|nr:alpha/beta fold hydrolase [Paenibacillus chitinolyticus]GKS11625.1 acetyltransferase [Paenibacillus chitinolyticus]